MVRQALLASLRRISAAISEAWELQQTLDLITRTTAEVMAMDCCSIYLLDEAGEHLVLESTTGLAPEAVGRARLRLGEGITGWAAETGEAKPVTDAPQHPRFKYLPETRELNFRSLLAQPLVSRGKVIGAINVQTTRRHVYASQEIELLGIIADLAAGALDRAMLYERMSRQAVENAELRVRAALVQEMHHRVKNNLQTVAMLLRLQMAEGRDGVRETLLREAEGRILSIALVHDILSKQTGRRVEVRELVQRIAQQVSRAFSRPGIEIQVRGDALELPSQPASSLALVVNELLDNALTHAFVGRQEGSVEVRLRRIPGGLAIEVVDDGVGLPPSRPSSLGLEIARTLVEEDLRGRLSVEGRPEGGTRAELTLKVEDALA